MLCSRTPKNFVFPSDSNPLPREGRQGGLRYFSQSFPFTFFLSFLCLFLFLLLRCFSCGSLFDRDAPACSQFEWVFKQISKSLMIIFSGIQNTECKIQNSSHRWSSISKNEKQNAKFNHHRFQPWILKSSWRLWCRGGVPPLHLAEIANGNRLNFYFFSKEKILKLFFRVVQRMLFNLCSTWPPRFPFIATGGTISFNAHLAGDGFGETVDRILSPLDGWNWIVHDWCWLRLPAIVDLRLCCPVL